MDFEDILIGKKERFTHLITKEEVNVFAKLTGDFNPIHVDDDYALNSNFGKRVVHGMLTSSFISTMIGMRIPGKGSLWLSQTLNFINPTFIGDTIEVLAEVVNVFQSTRTLKLKIEIKNQNDLQLVHGEAIVKMLEVKKKTKRKMKNKIVLISGGSRGIGAATARKMIENGYFVVINFKSQSEFADKLVEELNLKKENAVAIQADISDEHQVNLLFNQIEKKQGKILNIVHCASPIPIPKSFEETNWKNFETHNDTQLKGAFNLIKRALPNMLLEKEGSVVNLGTIFTDGTPPKYQSPYISSKAALISFTKSLAVEYGPKGIRFNVVNPGMTHTQMISGIPDKTKLLTKMNTPLKSLADPEDVANSIEFLLSDKAAHITGEIIRVCGGIYMG
jgi:3-oxoacyl-[acyl-carrier protein] reductase